MKLRGQWGVLDSIPTLPLHFCIYVAIRAKLCRCIAVRTSGLIDGSTNMVILAICSYAPPANGTCYALTGRVPRRVETCTNTPSHCGKCSSLCGAMTSQSVSDCGHRWRSQYGVRPLLLYLRRGMKHAVYKFSHVSRSIV